MIAEKVLDVAVKGLDRWDNGSNLDDILDALSTGKDKELRSKVSAVLFVYFRNKLYLDFIIDSMASKKVEPLLKRVISISLVQIFFLDGVAKEIAVDVAVNYTTRRKNKNAAGFVNAILRNAIRGKFEELANKAPEHVNSNIPKLLLSRWKSFFSIEELSQIKENIKKQASFTFRQLKPIDRSLLDSCFCEPIEGINYCKDFMFYKTKRLDLVLQAGLIDSGSIYIQDPATAMAACLVNLEGAKKILDLCSAPGGKTLMLSELYKNSEIVAMDRSKSRLERVTENIKRIQRSNVVTVVADALKPPFEKNSFDIVLADVPCSNTGVIRRRPDALWRFTQNHLNQIVKCQQDIIKSATELIKPGGLLIYSTCSIENDENRLQIDTFLAENSNFEFVTDKLLLPAENNDGAYGAVIRKKL